MIDKTIGVMTLLLSVIVFNLFWHGPATAQQKKYWIDDVQRVCHANAQSGLHSAIAYSDTGMFSCAWNYPASDAAKREAIKSCTAELPTSAKTGAPCRVIVLNKKVTDTRTVRNLKRNIHLSSVFEIFDRTSGKLQTFRGYIELGRLSGDRKRQARLITDAGLVLCQGIYGQSGNFIDFSLLCFGEFRFSKSLISPIDYSLSQGVYKPNFQIRLQKGGSYLAITSQN